MSELRGGYGASSEQMAPTAQTSLWGRSLAECELVVERGQQTFIEVGLALLEIRDRRLYRDSWGTFEDYCRERWGWTREHGYRLMQGAEVAQNVISTSQFAPSQSQAIALAPLPVDEQRAIAHAVDFSRTTVRELQGMVRELQALPPHVTYNSGEHEWYTPPGLIEAARATMGSIDTDPASTPRANETVQASTFYDAEQDGLAHPWHGNVWLNPPYAQPLISQFANATVEKYAAGQFGQACVLVNNATETGWFQNMLGTASALCFVRRRVRFLGPKGNPGAPLQGQIVLYLGDEVGAGRFGQHFEELGTVTPGRRWLERRGFDWPEPFVPARTEEAC